MVWKMNPSELRVESIAFTLTNDFGHGSKISPLWVVRYCLEVGGTLSVQNLKPEWLQTLLVGLMLYGERLWIESGWSYPLGEKARVPGGAQLPNANCTGEQVYVSFGCVSHSVSVRSFTFTLFLLFFSGQTFTFTLFYSKLVFFPFLG